MKKVFVMMVIVSACALTTMAECTAADRSALGAFDRAWSAAGTAGDRAALMGIYVDDYKSMPAGTTKTAAIDNAVATAERLRNTPARDTVTHDHYSITCSGSSAMVMHRNVITPPAGSANMNPNFNRSVHYLEKRGGKWQAVGDAGGPLNDAGVIWYLEQDWNNAAPKRDKQWFEQNWAPEFVSVSSVNGHLTGKAQEIADMMSDRGTLELTETTDMNIRVEGDSATVTGIYRMKGKDDKNVGYDRKIRYIDTWVKRDGRWLAVSSAGAIIKD